MKNKKKPTIHLGLHVQEPHPKCSTKVVDRQSPASPASPDVGLSSACRGTWQMHPIDGESTLPKLMDDGGYHIRTCIYHVYIQYD